MEIISFRFQDFLYYFVCCNRYNGAYSYYYRYEAEGTKYYRLESGSLFVGYIPRLSVYGEYDTQSVSSRYFFVCHCRRASYLRDGHRDVARGGDFQE